MTKTLYFPVMNNGTGLCRMEWASAWIRLGLSGVLGPYNIICETLSFPYPDGNANIATHLFLKSKADEMVIIDTDIVFTPKHVGMLLSHDVPLVSGIYPKKVMGLEYPIGPLESDPDPFSHNGASLCEVEYVARGFLRIKREVFESLKNLPDIVSYHCPHSNEDQLEYWKNFPGGDSDDFNFCKRYRAVGGKVFVDKRITLQHAGNVLYPIKGTYPE
jgi:hypothetical protein